ncbi:hypothetical protein [Pantoea sp. MBLJ3]|uniref:hypothetical protein n=1 Tax=Pantoea sp. MBLJ3 TaxID=1562889 RepID=UPI00057FCE70|nr:hypothetical protein [Pantoea sp. MBLJ3]
MISKEIMDAHMKNVEASKDKADDVFDNNNFFGESTFNSPNNVDPNSYEAWINNIVEMKVTLEQLHQFDFYVPGNAFIRTSGPFDVSMAPRELFEKSLTKEVVQDYINSDVCTKYEHISFERKESEYPNVFNVMFNY